MEGPPNQKEVAKANDRREKNKWLSNADPDRKDGYANRSPPQSDPEASPVTELSSAVAAKDNNHDNRAAASTFIPLQEPDQATRRRAIENRIMNMVVHAKDPQVLADFIKAQVLTRMLFEGRKKQTQKPEWDVDPDPVDEGVKPYVPKIAPDSTSVPLTPFHAARAGLLDLSISGGNQVKGWGKAMENAMENSARHVAAMNEGSSAKTLSTPTSTMANRSIGNDDEESDSWTTANRMEYLVNSMADESIEDFAEDDEQTSEHDVGIVAPSESDKVEPMVTGAAVEHPVTDIAPATAGDKVMAPSAAPAALVPKSATLRELMGTVKRLLISSRSQYNFEDVTYTLDFQRAVEIVGADQFCRLPGSTRDVLRPGSIFNKGAAEAGLPAGIHRWLQGSPEATQTFRYAESVINKTVQQLTRLGIV